MAATMPTEETALLMVSGVGKHKLRRFGGEFLDEIISYAGR
jgi:superfamily II DNA helicase RecQ